MRRGKEYQGDYDDRLIVVCNLDGWNRRTGQRKSVKGWESSDFTEERKRLVQHPGTESSGV